MAQCQSRPLGIAVLASQTDTTTYKQNFVSYDSATSKIAINLGSNMLPQQFYLKIRYYDLESGSASTSYYHDHYIMIRIVAQTNLTLSASNMDYCIWNPFPVSYGNTYYSYQFSAGGLFVSNTDFNIIIGGNANGQHAALINEDNYDGFVMRISQTGYVEWLTQISTMRGNSDKIDAVTLQNSQVYSFLSTIDTAMSLTQNAIIKLTYSEGKLQWARSILPVNLIDTRSFMIHRCRELVNNPRQPSQIMSSLIYGLNYDYQYSGNIMLKDNGTHLVTDFHQIVKPLANPNSYNNHGQVLFDYNDDFVYVAHLGYITSSSIYDNIVVKQSTVDGTVAWSRQFSFGSNPITTGIMQPNLAFNNITKMLYVVSTNGHALLTKIDTDGDLKKRSIVKVSNNQGIQNIQIAIDNSNNNIILVTQNSGTSRVEIVTLDENFGQVSQTYTGHGYLQQNSGRIIHQIQDWYFMVTDVSRFTTNSYSGGEIVLSKKSIKYYDSGKYECHIYSQITNVYSLLTDFPITNTALTDGALYISKDQLMSLDNGDIKSNQLQSYNTKLNPQGDNVEGLQNPFNQYNSNMYCSNMQGYYQPPSTEYETLEVTMGSSQTFTISTSKLKQCSGSEAYFNPIYMVDENQNNTSNMWNPWIKISGNTIIVDATVNANPSYRLLSIGIVCLSIASSQCTQNVSIPLIIWPKVEPEAPKKYPEKLCLSSESYPKSIQTSTLVQHLLYSADVDKESGNFLLCGQHNQYLVRAYFGGNPSFILLSDINGRIHWAYEAVLASVTFNNASAFAGCQFTSDQSYVYSMILAPQARSGIIKQNYTNGKIIYAREIIGNFYSYNQMFLDKVDNAIYITGQRNDFPYPYPTSYPYWLWYIAKHDVSVNYPTQKWYSYMTQSSYQDPSQQIIFVQFSRTKDALYLAGVSYYGYNGNQQVISKYMKTTGQKLKMVHVNMYVSFNTAKHYLDNNDNLYFSSTSSSSPYSKYMNKFDSNLNQLKMQQLSMSSYLQGGSTFSNSLDGDESDTYLYETFVFDSVFLYVVKYRMDTLEVLIFKGTKIPYSCPIRGLFIFVLDDKIFQTIQACSIYGSSDVREVMVNMIDLDLNSPYSCFPYMDMQINSTFPALNSLVFNDASAYYTQVLYQFDYKLPPFFRFYFELVTEISRFAFGPAKNLQCQNMGPVFEKDLEDQIITLPMSNHEYTFDWPNDCSGENLNFTWSVDAYTVIPPFMTMTNTSSTSTLTLTPTTANLGTYIVRVQFAIGQSPFHQVQKTFIVEIYPETNYGSTISSESCGGSIMLPAFFAKEPYFQQLYGDISDEEDSILMCGNTVTTNVISLNPGYWSGFILAYTMNLAPKFFITVEATVGYGHFSTLYCKYGQEGNIYSITDYKSYGVLFTKHSKYGKYIDGRIFYTGDKYVYFQRAHLNTNNGDQYIAGQSYNALFSVYGTTSQSFIMRIDADWNVVSVILMRLGYWLDPSIHSLLVDPDNKSFYLVASPYFSVGEFYFVIAKINETDSQLNWGKQIYDSQNTKGITRMRNSAYYEMYQITAGLLLVEGYLYSCITPRMFYTSYTTDVILTKHDPSTGVKLQRSEIGYVVSTSASVQNNITFLGCQLGYHSVSNMIYMAFTDSNYGFQSIVAFYANSTTTSYIDYKYTVLRQSSTKFEISNYQFIERNSKLYVFFDYSRRTPINAYSFVATISDFYNNKFDGTCSALTVSSISDSQYQAPPTGAQGDQSTFWTDVLIKDWWTTSVDINMMKKHIQRIQNVRMYVTSNSSADVRGSFCKILVNPYSTPVNNRTGNPINSTSGGFAVGSNNYTLILPKFSQCSYMPITYTITFTPTNGSTFMSLNQTLSVLTISPYNSQFTGSYLLRYTGALTENAQFKNFTDFYIDITQNYAPVARLNFPTSVTIYARHDYSQDIILDYDIENDEASFSVTALSATGASLGVATPWLKIDSTDNQGISFSVIDAPQPTSLQTNYTLRVSIKDLFNLLTPQIYDIMLTVNKNDGPVMTQNHTTNLPPIYITKSFAYTFWYQNFTDFEGDQVKMSCAITSDTIDHNWINFEVNQTEQGNITFFGQTPRDNNYAGTYILSCQLFDQFKDYINTYNYTQQVLPKEQINILKNQNDLKLRLPKNISLSFADFNNDPQEEPNYYSLYVNETLYNSANFAKNWTTWDNEARLLLVAPFNNSQAGNLTISIKFDDLISVPRYVNFTIEILQNWPLIPLKTLPALALIINNWFFYDYDRTQIFQNPENETFSMYFRMEQSGNTLPFFISKNFSNGTIGGFPIEADVGIFNMECVGIDDGYQETPIPFIMIIKPCYYKCMLCFDSDYNTCNSCKPTFFYFNHECLDECIEGTYPVPENWNCQLCPSLCKACTGNDTLSQCQKCKKGIFYLDNGCYVQCPNGYWGDKSDYTCKICNSACTLCYGPSSLQCNNCTDVISIDELGYEYKFGYLLSGTECRIPKCVVGQYFQWNDYLTNKIHQGQCKDCHPTCKRCTGPYSNLCVECYPGYILNTTDNQCIPCEDIYGYFTNEEYECEEICGDGILVAKQCDDGNVLSGDGCSQLCALEYGFECQTPNKTCRENIIQSSNL